MSEISRIDHGRGHGETARRTLALLAAGLAAIFAVAISGASLPVTVGAAAMLLGLALVLVTARTADTEVQKALPEPLADSLPQAARDILECLDDPVLVVDLDGRVLFANRSAHAVVGTDADRKHISALLRTPSLLEAVEHVGSGGAAETVTFSVPVPVQRHYQAYVTRTRSQHPEGALLLIQIRDLTALRKAEEMRADFVANASHELRTPLAAVSGFIDTLRGHAKNDPDARERFLEIMSIEAARMRRLIEDLLSLTRIELNEHNPPASEVDLTDVVKDAANALAPLAQEEAATITIAAHEPLIAIGDRDELIQVFQNLIHNAIKYGRHGGEIRLGFGRVETTTKRDGSGQVFVSVTDEGEGIPREAVPRLTERFYRVDVRRSRERGGTGLGLAIVKHILNRHHGRLQIESTPGKGSTFTVFLPASKTVPVPSSGPLS